MSIHTLTIDVFGPLLHRATGQASVGASTLLRRAAAGPWSVVVTDLRGAGNVRASLDKAGVDVPPGVDVVPVVDFEEPVDRVRAIINQADTGAGEMAVVVSTPWAAFASVRAGATVVAVAQKTAGTSLQQSGARRRYDDAESLAAELEAAMQACGPQSFAMTDKRLATLMDGALDAARSGMDAGEIPIGSTLVSASGDELGRGHNEARGRNLPTAHAEMQAIADAAQRHDLKAQDGLVLVTTMEPCAMCFGAALEVGIDAIVYAVEAPENGAIGRCTPNRGPGAVHPRVIGGVGRDESIQLLREWTDARPESGFASRLLDAVSSPTPVST
jgi:tRNA(Arg) A34 adenosine deaminase TadA